MAKKNKFQKKVEQVGVAVEKKVEEVKKAVEGKKPEKSKKVYSFETTRLVSFIVNGMHYDGNKFNFDSKAEMNDAKNDLVASLGEEVIVKEEEK